MIAPYEETGWGRPSPRPTGLTRWERFLEFMGWHKPSRVARFNAASANGFERVCERCGARLLMDSQGNWFAVAGHPIGGKP